jgi:copper chaperone CopZ
MCVITHVETGIRTLYTILIIVRERYPGKSTINLSVKMVGMVIAYINKQYLNYKQLWDVRCTMACKTIEIIVNDMHCANCEIRIEKHLNKLDGVVYVKASYSRSKVTVTYSTEAISIEDIIREIEKAGYTGQIREEKVQKSVNSKDKENLKARNGIAGKGRKRIDNIKLIVYLR